jgi:hypothetical protein
MLHRTSPAYLRSHGRIAEGYLKGARPPSGSSAPTPRAELDELAERARNLDAERVVYALSNGAPALDSALGLREGTRLEAELSCQRAISRQRSR